MGVNLAAFSHLCRINLLSMFRFIFFVCCLLTGMNSFSQSIPSDVFMDNQLNPYLEHTVGAKENFYSIGRMYNLSPKIIAPYNKLDLEKSGLSIGQKIMIPLVANNFWQKGARTAQEVTIPLYYKAPSKSSLATIAKDFKTTIAELKSWNQGIGDELNAGSRIVIGFLKIDKNVSSLAEKASPVRQDPVITTTPKEEKNEPVKTTNEDKPADNKVVKVNETKPSQTTDKKDSIEISNKYTGEGIFRSEYEAQIKASSASKTESGKGTVFKTTSGWTDGKYYLIIDGIERGTIVLIKNTVTGKIVYAKVLSTLQEVKENAPEKFIISEAAASQLGVKGSEFSAEIIWPVE